MAEKLVKKNEEQKAETHTRRSREATSAEGLLYEYLKGGRTDFGILSPGKQRELATEYIKRFDDFSEKAQTEILEQFLLSGAINEREAIVITDKMDAPQAAEIGEYLGRVVAPGRYIKLFQYLLPTIPLGERKEIENRLLRENPTTDTILMMAPFIDLGKPWTGRDRNEEALARYRREPIWSMYNQHGYIRKLEKEEARQPEELKERLAEEKAENFKSYIEKYFADAGSASRLMDMILENENFAAAEKMTEAVINGFFKNDNDELFLLTYIPKILKRKLVSPHSYAMQKIEDVITQLKKDDGLADLELKFEYYLTPEEAARRKEILRTATKNPDDKDAKWDPQFKAGPTFAALAREYYEIEDRATLRGGKQVASAFPEIAKLVGEDGKQLALKNLHEAHVPILSFTEEAGLNEKEVARFMAVNSGVGGDAVKMPDVATVQKLIEMGLEKMVVQSIVGSIEGGWLYDESTHFFTLSKNIREILEMVSGKSKKTLIDAINKNGAKLWTTMIDYAVDGGFITLDNLASELHRQGELVRYYPNIVYKLRKTEPDEETFQNKRRRLKTMVIAQIESQPEILFWDRDNLPRSLSKEEIFDITDKILNGDGAAEFATKLISRRKKDENKEGWEASPHADKIRDVLIKTLNTEPERVFRHDYGYQIKQYADVVGWPKITTAFIDHITDLRCDEILESTGITSQLAENQNLWKKFLAYASTSGGRRVILPCIKGLSKIKEADKNESAGDFSGAIQTMLTLYEQAATSDKFFVLEYPLELASSDIPGKLLRTIAGNIEAHAGEYIRLAPHKITSVTKTAEKFLGHDATQEIIRRNLLRLVTGEDKYGYELYSPHKLDTKTKLEIIAQNPAKKLGFEGGVGTRLNPPKHYYDAAIELLSANPFYGVYAKKLKAISDEERELHGEILSVPKNTNSEYGKIERDLIILANCSFINTADASHFSKLSKPTRRKVVELARITARYQITALPKHPLTPEGIKAAEQDISKILAGKLGQLMSATPAQVREMANMRAKELNALTVYYSTSCKDNPPMNKVFRQFIGNMLGENYKNMRAWEEAEPADKSECLVKLKKENLLPGAITLPQYQKWVAGKTELATENLKLSTEDIQRALNGKIMEAIFDKHVDEETARLLEMEPAEQKGLYEELIAPLTALQERMKALTKGPIENSDEVAGIKTEIEEYREEHEQKINKLRAAIIISRLKHITPEELEKNSINVLGKTVGMDQAWRTIDKGIGEEFPDFKNDAVKIRSIITESRKEMFSDARISKSELIVTDEVDLATHILIGQEPVPSCQNYEDGSYNEGLLSYIVDPGVKILQMRNEEGEIIARSIMRLMEDDEGNPYLFLERLYSSNAHPKIAELAYNFAKKKADEMDIPLCGEEVFSLGETDTETVKLHSRGSRAPYVYTDAGGGLRAKGIFSATGVVENRS